MTCINQSKDREFKNMPSSYSTKMRVYQNFGYAPIGVASDQNVFVFGPRYDLHRYDDEDEKSKLVPYDYEMNVTSAAAANTTISGVFGDVAVNYELDESSVKVFAEDAFSCIRDFSVEWTPAGVSIAGNSYYDGVVRIAGIDLSGSTESTLAELKTKGFARALKAGDYIAFQKQDSSSGLVTRFMQIASLEYGTWTVEAGGGQEDGEETQNSEVTGTTVTFTTGFPDDLQTLEGVTVVIGLEKASSIELPAASFSVSGSDVVISSQRLPASYAGHVNGLARPLFCGTLYVEYRTLDVGTQSSIEVLSSVGDVESVLGPADPRNPISLGVMNAFIGGAPVVYYYCTPGSDAKAIGQALVRAEQDRTLYFLVPMTQDRDALHTVVSHCVSMSNAEKARWRLPFMCTPVSRETETDVSVTGFGAYQVKGTSYKTVKVASVPEDLTDGDSFTAVVGGTTYEFTVARRLNDTTILLDEPANSAPASGTGTGKIVHSLSTDEYVVAVAAATKSYSTFRVVDCFPKTYGYDGNTYSSMFLAPIVAGLAASVQPQAPITNKTVPGVDDLPETYSGLSQAQLDKIAAGGVLIVTQDLRGEAVYVRRQLTAGASEGNLLTAELSLVKNADNVTHGFNRLLDEFKGAYNVTPGLIDRVWTDLSNLVYRYMTVYTDDLIGPQLLTGSEVLDVYVDPTNATRIIAHIRCILPAPFNEMDLYLSFDVTTEVTASVGESTSAE